MRQYSSEYECLALTVSERVGGERVRVGGERVSVERVREWVVREC